MKTRSEGTSARSAFVKARQGLHGESPTSEAREYDSNRVGATKKHPKVFLLVTPTGLEPMIPP